MTDLRTRAAMQATPGDIVPVGDDSTASASTYQPIADTDDGIPAGMDVSVHVAWSRVQAEVQGIAKKQQRSDPGGKYNFRGIDAILNVVGPALRKHAVTVVQTGVVPEYRDVTTGNNRVMRSCVVTVTYTVYGPKGDSFAMQSLGEAFDAGDKSTPKAMSVALRTLYINSLAIPTNEPKMDADNYSHEMVATPPPSPSEYLAEIVNPNTTVQRLLQIKGELTRHQAIGEASVSDEQGADWRLIDLLTKVGRERAAAAKPA